MPAISSGAVCVISPITLTVWLTRSTRPHTWPNPVSVADQLGGPLGAETDLYVQNGAPGNSMNTAAVSTIGGQPHSNQMPTIVLNFCICLNGIFPSRN
jgi:microcystin-dependent protein